MNQLSHHQFTKPMFEHERIIANVANQHGVTVEHLRSQRNRVKLCEARDQAYYELWQPKKRSLNMIGTMFGGRHHTTILQGIKRHKQRLGL